MYIPLLFVTDYDSFKKQSSPCSKKQCSSESDVILVFLQLASFLSLAASLLCLLNGAQPLSGFFFSNMLGCLYLLSIGKLHPCHFEKWRGVHAACVMTFFALAQIEPEISFQENNLSIIFLVLDNGYIFFIAQLSLNWQIKAGILLLFKTVICLVLELKVGSLSYLFLYVYFFSSLMGFLIFYQNESQLLEIFKLNKTNEEEKLGWLHFINKLPLFVLEYDTCKFKLVKYNEHLKNFMQMLRRANEHSENILSQGQDIRVTRRNVVLQNSSLEELFKWICQQQIQQLEATFDLWKKDFIITWSKLSEERTIFILVDVSMSRQLQMQELSQRMVRVLYQSLTHKFMTPINSIKSILYFLQSRLKEFTLNDQIEACMESVFTLEQLMQNLNDLSACQVSRLVVNIVVTPLKSLLRESFEAFKNQVNQKGLKYQIDISSWVPHRAKVDPKRLKQIIYILIYNAIKYTSAGGIMVRAEFDSSQDPTQLVIIVKDTGCGMSNELIDKAFKLFNNLEQRENINSHGMGLNLTILNEVVQALKGRIFIKSEVNIGTQFTITLPLEIIPNSENFLESLQSVMTQNSCSPRLDQQIKTHLSLEIDNVHYFHQHRSIDDIPEPKILIVDDDPLNLYALELIFENEGFFQLEKARNGLEAVSMVKKGPEFRLVVMDLNMPGMNGIEAAKEIRRMGESGQASISNTMIYVHSAITGTIEWQEVFDGILSKPVNIEEIRELARTVLKR